MSGFDSSLSGGSDYEIDAPVLPLKDGLTINELVEKKQIEFEVMPQEEEEESNAEPYLNFEDMKKFINLDVTDVDDADGEDASPFDKYRRKMTSIREDGKVMKYIVKEGFGPFVPDNSVVYMRYQGYFEYQEEPFDSTVVQWDMRRDDPKPFNLAKQQLLLGLHEALLTMRKGEKAEILIDPDLAYGKLGCPPRIPADAPVLFIVEVDRFVDCGEGLKDDDDMDMEERSQFKHVNKKAKGLYLLGNDHFRNENFSQAASRYKQVVNMLHNSRLADEQEEAERNHFLIKIYSNLCICYHKMKNYKRVCCMAADAMKTSETEARKNCKLLYFWGYAKMMLTDYDGAQKHLTSAKKLNPRDPEITKALSLLMKKREDAKQAEKLLYQRAFSMKPTSSSVKITEINEGDEELKSVIREELRVFKDQSDEGSMYLKDQVSPEDERIWLEVAKELGLYARVASGAKRLIHIKKSII